jgi:hypothetical protein
MLCIFLSINSRCYLERLRRCYQPLRSHRHLLLYLLDRYCLLENFALLCGAPTASCPAAANAEFEKVPMAIVAANMAVTATKLIVAIVLDVYKTTES